MADNVPYTTPALIALVALVKNYRASQIEQVFARAEKKQADERLSMAFGTPVTGMKLEFKA